MSTHLPLSPAAQAASQAIDSALDSLTALSRAIGNDPELAFEEHRAAARVAQALTDAGFLVHTGAYGLPTAVAAEYGSGEFTIVVVGEYDALPEVGHACGHNVIAAAGVGAAIGLRAVADQLGIRVRFLGTPAEESGGGKNLMLERGAWDDGTLSVMVHGGPQPQTRSVGGTTQALEYFEATFTGRAAHAAFAPHEGINAGDAVTLAQVAFGLLRQQLPDGVVVSSISQTGVAANIIPESGTLCVEVRAHDAESWATARARVRAAIDGAALASGCTVTLRHPEIPYAPLAADPELTALFDEHLAGLLGERSSDWAPGMSGGSTDMGNVSQYLPSIHPMVALPDTAALPHHHSFAEAARGEAGDSVVRAGAISLALTAISAAENTELRERLLDQQRARAPHPRPAN